jgi:very-long-chain (3R)-3-hydroxyacyl-CoA dehydratase
MAGVGSALRRFYLSVYNWVVFFGWSVAFALAACSSVLLGFRMDLPPLAPLALSGF